MWLRLPPSDTAQTVTADVSTGNTLTILNAVVSVKRAALRRKPPPVLARRSLTGRVTNTLLKIERAATVVSVPAPLVARASVAVAPVLPKVVAEISANQTPDVRVLALATNVTDAVRRVVTVSAQTAVLTRRTHLFDIRETGISVRTLVQTTWFSAPLCAAASHEFSCGLVATCER